MARIAHKEGAAVLKHLKEQEPPRLDDGTAAEQPGLEQWTAWNAAVVQDEESVLKLNTKLDEIKNGMAGYRTAALHRTRKAALLAA